MLRRADAWWRGGLRLALLPALALLLSSAVQAREQAGCDSTVKVAPGDTLSRIARRCGTSVAALTRENPGLRNPDIIEIGTVLTLPRHVAEAHPSTSSESTGVLTVEPPEVAPGESVTLTAFGLPPHVRVWIKGGSAVSPKHHLVMRAARTDADGSLRITLRLPPWTATGPGRFNLSVEVPRTGAMLSHPAIRIRSTDPPDQQRTKDVAQVKPKKPAAPGLPPS